MSTGLIIFGHGSSVPSANASVEAVAAAVSREGGFPLVQAAFLEHGQPDLAGAVARLMARGATRILVLPHFLTLGIHLQRDLPVIAREIAARHPGLEIRVGPPLDGHPALSRILVDRALAELASWGSVSDLSSNT